MPAAAGNPRLELAAQDDPIFAGDAGAAVREQAFVRMAELGMTWLRVNVSWAEANGRQAVRTTTPGRPRYSWRRIDDVVAEARRHGVRVQLTLMGPAPAWATGKRRIGNYRPRASAFAGFAAATARHFRGVVTRYAIWNEPNHGAFLSPQYRRGRPVSPGIYRALYRAGWTAIKMHAPHASVLIGETCPCGTSSGTVVANTFIESLACGPASRAGRRPCERLLADGFAHHPYQAPAAPERPVAPYRLGIGSLAYLGGLLDVYARLGALTTPGGRPLPIYLTEFGYQSAGPSALPERTRVRYLPRAFEIAYRDARVKQITHYQLVSGRSLDWDSGIFAMTGHPDASFTALRRWAQRRGFVQPRWNSSAADPSGGTPAP